MLELGSGCTGPKAKLRPKKTNSASVESSEADASSEDELLGEQNQVCPLLELCSRYTVGRVLEKARGTPLIPSAAQSRWRVSVRC